VWSPGEWAGAAPRGLSAGMRAFHMEKMLMLCSRLASEARGALPSDCHSSICMRAPPGPPHAPPPARWAPGGTVCKCPLQSPNPRGSAGSRSEGWPAPGTRQVESFYSVLSMMTLSAFVCDTLSSYPTEEDQGVWMNRSLVQLHICPWGQYPVFD
jgi:hypothetical protein